MLVAAAKTLLKRYGFDDTDPLADWLQAGVYEVENAHDWDFLQLRTTVNVTALDDTPTLPADTAQVYSVRNITTEPGYKLAYRSMSEFEREVEDGAEGLPYYYTVLGDGESLFLAPTPDVATVLRVVYQQDLGAVGADGASMPGPARLHYTYVRAAAFIALQAENEEERAQTAQTQFEADLAKLIRRYNKQELDEPQQVTNIMEY